MGECCKFTKNWQQQVPRLPRVPMDEPLLWAMVVIAWIWSWIHFAAALAVGFTGYLRPGKIGDLCAGDFKLVHSVGLNIIGVVVAIHKAKTRFRTARVQAVYIDNHSVAWLVAVWL